MKTVDVTMAVLSNPSKRYIYDKYGRMAVEKSWSVIPSTLSKDEVSRVKSLTFIVTL